MTKEEFCKELKESQKKGILAVCSIGQQYINSLEAENERLKDKIAAYEDERKCLSETITSDADVICRINKENSKLKCLILHLFGRIGFYASEWYSEYDEERQVRRAVKWWKIHIKYNKAYRKAKAALKEGK